MLIPWLLTSCITVYTITIYVDPMIINVLYHCVHHYNTLLISWLLMYCIIVYTITIYVDPMIINVLYHCLHHYNTLLISWLLMSCIIVYTITIHCWSHAYDWSVSLSSPLQYIADPMILNVLYQCLHHYNILLVPCLRMSCMTVNTNTM